MTEPVVLKFGGASLRDESAIRQCLAITARQTPPTVAVVSAMEGMTDLLLQGAERARQGQSVAESLKEFDHTYRKATKALVDEPDAMLATLDGVVSDLGDIFASIATLGEYSDRIRDKIVSRGEFCMAQLFAAASDATYVDAMDIIQLGHDSEIDLPDLELTAAAAAETLRPALTGQGRTVVPGFYGRNAGGHLKTLGRGGTDLSATVIGHAISAQAVYLYKDIPGILTADPRSVPAARIVPALHYREASELAYYGAKVLHPRTIIPLLAKTIPLYIRNTFDPDEAGTRVAADVKAGAFPVKALTAIRNQALVTIEGNGMMGVPGIAGRTFSTLANQGASVSVISQASSESSICFVVPNDATETVIRALNKEFRFEREHKLIDAIRAETDRAVIAVVGLGMRGTKGIAARSFNALADHGVSVDAIAQGASELNISIVVHGEETDQALRGLHQEFHLERLTSHDQRQQGQSALHLFGFGSIGRALSRQLLAQQEYFQQKMALHLPQVSFTDSSGCVAFPEGASSEEVQECIRVKENRGRVAETTEQSTPIGLEMLGKTIFVDLTAAETTDTVIAAMEKGWHVALANKKPMAGPQKDYDHIMALAKEKQSQIRYEATVGAGLPLLDTITKLMESGDEILSIQGCLSGTLGYLFSQVEQGVAFSEAVRHAHRQGITEPDPRDDLGGMDVARKALILARRLGHRLELKDLSVTALYEESQSDDDPQTFIENLKQLDGSFKQKIDQAKTDGKVLRYIASVNHDQVKVGIEAVPLDSPLGGLKGTDNQITIRSRRYDANPLILTGPGAGVDVTAAGVLNDIIAIASQGS